MGKIKHNAGYQTTVVPDEVEPDQELWGGGYSTDFLHSIIFIIFKYCLNKCQLLNITFIFDRCCRSSAAVTPVKYEWDSKNVHIMDMPWGKFYLSV